MGRPAFGITRTPQTTRAALAGWQEVAAQVLLGAGARWGG
ncbi:hypothetical protein L332_05120 [Agrococcus pavilionensis RW1]|uniref:Uncharacterized protein n=1 Tax=Agrococcus pavilionensis RW1 TaxID=1330458 RepID=U1LPD6_9MICO|nr:hypothetical protein L332_05120 [Agrococcus pavilionensis RW1]